MQQELGEVTTLHGVFLDVLEIGVLITGDSSIGKSELALELISRGHGLVADDVVELQQIGPETIQGRCPPMLRDFLEVRGPGRAQHPLDLRRDRGAAAQGAAPDGAPRHAGAAASSRSDRARRRARARRTSSASRFPRSRSPWRRGATSRCWWRPRCATTSSSRAASTPRASSSRARKRRCARGARARRGRRLMQLVLLSGRLGLGQERGAARRSRTPATSASTTCPRT